MQDQHLLWSNTLEVSGHYRLLLPRLRVDFFSIPGLKNCWPWWPGIEPTTLDLSSQSGAFDLSATVTP